MADRAATVAARRACSSDTSGDTAGASTTPPHTSGLNDWAGTAAGWTAGYDLTRSEGRTRFRVHVSRETDRNCLTVAHLCQIAARLGAANPPGSRAAAQRTLADILITRSLVERRGAHLVAGRVTTANDGAAGVYLAEPHGRDHIRDAAGPRDRAGAEQPV